VGNIERGYLPTGSVGSLRAACSHGWDFITPVPEPARSFKPKIVLARRVIAVIAITSIISSEVFIVTVGNTAELQHYPIDYATRLCTKFLFPFRRATGRSSSLEAGAGPAARSLEVEDSSGLG